MEKGPLFGIKVLELSNVLAGPSVGVALAELGATVIKVENLLTQGDVTRTWKLPTEDSETDISGYFSCINWGKKSISLDLNKQEGLELIYKLTEVSDIVLVSYKPGDAEKLRVNYNTLKARNNRLIYVHLTGYGLKNPRAGYDAIIQAESGFTYMNGEPDGKPVKMPVALMDILAGHQLKEAILLALLNREKNGNGQYIETSLIKSGVASLANQATNWLVGNNVPQRMGSDHPNIVPYGTIFYSKDKKPIVLAIGSDKHFADLCKVLGKSELAKDSNYSTNFVRVKNRDELNILIQNLIEQFYRDQLLDELSKKNVPAGGVYDMKEVFELPEIQELIMESETTGGIPIKGLRTIAFSMDGKTKFAEISAPPHYGEHTQQILKDFLGYSNDKINELMENQVIYVRNKSK
ncbi:MAG: carnitine dehydratase [Bacteroidetes bacterium GWF2_33_16]|nr:MAG: carnitine dehydratase [Bacteroidetes bacterium GWE2_32_14]OFY06493.1 MAG: carnitine dehydratase [Bacteroidetes bacterium GWF2_33_16]